MNWVPLLEVARIELDDIHQVEQKVDSAVEEPIDDGNGNEVTDHVLDLGANSVAPIPG